MKNHLGIDLGIFLIFLCIAFIFATGCTSQTVSTESTLVPTTTTPILTTPTISSTPSVSSTPYLASTPPDGWKKYTVAEDHFEINVPTTWTVTQRDKSMMRSYFLDALEVQNVNITPMNKVLYLTQPSSDTTAIITGVELSSDNGPEISNSYYLRQFLPSYVHVVGQGIVNAPPTKEIDGVVYENVFSHGSAIQESIDPIIYNINGNNGMRAGINILNGEGKNAMYCQIIVIQYKNRIYCVEVEYTKNNAPTTDAEISTVLESLNILP
jgi:hypothetical protein